METYRALIEREKYDPITRGIYEDERDELQRRLQALSSPTVVAEAHHPALTDRVWGELREHRALLRRVEDGQKLLGATVTGAVHDARAMHSPPPTVGRSLVTWLLITVALACAFSAGYDSVRFACGHG